MTAGNRTGAVALAVVLLCALQGRSNGVASAAGAYPTHEPYPTPPAATTDAPYPAAAPPVSQSSEPPSSLYETPPPDSAATASTSMPGGDVPVSSASASMPSPLQPLSSGDLKALYERVRNAVNSFPVPEYAAFTLENATQQSGTVQQERLGMVVRESDGTALVRTIRDADGNSGADAPQLVTTPLFPMTNIYRAGDFALADFGLRIVARPRPGIFDAPGTPEPESSGEPLRTLASVTVVDLPYVLTDLGPATIGERSVYHIGLEPKRDPGHHVIRQLWIDPDTYLPLRYVADRFVEDTVPFHYLVTVETSVVAGHLVNTSATGRFDVADGPNDRLTGETHWRISRIGFPETEPPWAFDPEQLPDHAQELIPGL